ncbi:MAG: phosphoribosylformylglycinamidine cyclo-ligase [Candidatus Pelagibacter sp.]|nr:phosphoribosylformylglycinamidine cyclo-ligase [Candidatus Pelagibacter sp.]
MKKKYNSYKQSGVNISLANNFVNHIKKITKNNDKNLNNIGAFGSIYDISKHKIKNPLLVSSTDGVGTKLELANKFQKFNTIGEDLVAMCVNDLIVQGAQPLFFLDYIAVGKLNLSKIKKILTGIISGCKKSNCSLIGGETAEMPGVYQKDKFDLAGFSVGIVSKKNLISKNSVKKNDLIIAIPSSGLHSNGFSLVRHLIKKKALTVAEKKELLKPTKIYVKEIISLCKLNLIHSLSNITGGGITENIVRSIPENHCAEIDLAKIKIKKVFKWIKGFGVDDKEMLKTFNCGVGFCLIIKENNFKKILKFFSKEYKPYKIGKVVFDKNRKINYLNNLKW